jgi:uncharacterized protein YjeT (DUF2065 family)
VSILKSSFVTVDRVKVEVVVVEGFEMPSIWKETALLISDVKLNPLRIVNILEAVLWLVVQSKTVPAGMPVTPVHVIDVGTVTELG